MFVRDVYTESVIPVPAKPAYKVYKYILIGLIALSLAAAGLLGLPVLLVTAVLVWLLYQVVQKSDGEYEYVHTNDCFDVDLVIHNARRRSLLSVNLQQVIRIHRAESPDAAPYKNVPTKDYSGNCSRDNLYEMVYTVSGSRRKILLQLDSDMYHSLKQWIPDRVK